MNDILDGQPRAFSDKQLERDHVIESFERSFQFKPNAFEKFISTGRVGPRVFNAFRYVAPPAALVGSYAMVADHTVKLKLNTPEDLVFSMCIFGIGVCVSAGVKQELMEAFFDRQPYNKYNKQPIFIGTKL